MTNEQLSIVLYCFVLYSYFYFTLTSNCQFVKYNHHHQCVKSVRIRSYSVQYFPIFGLNTERVSLSIQSKCRKIRIGITPNTDTFYAVYYKKKYSKKILQNDLQEFRLFFVRFVVDFCLVFSDLKTFFKIASEAATGGVL